MFSRVSRYRPLPDAAVPDARRARLMESRALRLLPDTPGTFLHVLQQGERLDHLAHKYYEQPREWWRIVDANPAFLSPRALMGAEPRATVRIPVAWTGPYAPWSVLLRALLQMPGVECARAGTEDQPEPVEEVGEGPAAFDLDPALRAALDDSAAAQALHPDLATALGAEGAGFSGEVRVEKVSVVEWRVHDPATRRVLAFVFFPDEDLLRAYDARWSHAWVVEAVYDTLTRTAEELAQRAEALGFDAGAPGQVGRTGKRVVIPPRTAV
jgi:hypothetical protein